MRHEAIKSGPRGARPNGEKEMHDEILGTSLPSVMALAFLGDACHSLYVRGLLVNEGISKSKDLNRRAQEYVTAEAQARMYRAVEPHLLPDEADLARRAINSGHLNRPKHASPADYRSATAFEAVLGMLEYIGDRERLRELLAIAHGALDTEEK